MARCTKCLSGYGLFIKFHFLWLCAEDALRVVLKGSVLWSARSKSRLAPGYNRPTASQTCGSSRFLNRGRVKQDD